MGTAAPGVLPSATGEIGAMGTWGWGGWMAIGLVAVGVGIVVAIGIRAQRQLAAAERGGLEGGRDEGDAPFATGQVLADLDELSNRLAEELEQKAARLERLIAEADERIARLEPVVQRAGRTGWEGRGGGNGEPEADPVNAQVYAMADRGCSMVEIAQALGQHVGKVELILALRR